MDNPVHAEFYADKATQHTVRILQNSQIAKETYRVRFECPNLACRILPGQFVMLRLAHLDDPLLGRPLALYDIFRNQSGDAIGIDVVYLVGGKMTKRLAEFQVGQQLDVWGPLGNGFAVQRAKHLVMVAGGIGQTPFLALAKEHLGIERYGNKVRIPSPLRRITFCYGARSADYFAGLADFESTGIDIQLSTDDGSGGHHGFVTDVLKQVIADSTDAVNIVCCGPEPMMEAVAKIAADQNLPCQVSLETPMACGIGICFTCVAKIQDETGQWDYSRTCVEGPVFEAHQIRWD